MGRCAIGACIGVVLLRGGSFHSLRLARLSFLTLPTALFGGVIPIFLFGDRTLSLGALIGLLSNPGNPNAAPEMNDVVEAARTLGLRTHAEKASSEAELDAAFAKFAERKVDAVSFAADAVFTARRKQIIELAERYKLPAMYF